MSDGADVRGREDLVLTIPAIIGLLIVIYIRPHEIFPFLSGLPVLHAFTALAILGFLVDGLLGRVNFRLSRSWWLCAGFLFWALVGVILSAGSGDVFPRIVQLLMVFSLFTVIAIGVQDTRRLSIVAGAVVGCNLLLAFVGVHQSMAPTGCVALVVEGGTVALGEGQPDGRPCFERSDCYDELSDPEREYLCERVGLLGTSSVQNRVRYRGILQDPNELAFTLAAMLPFLFVLAGRGSPVRGAVLLLGGVVVVLWCVVATQSRSGQLANLAVLGVYFVKRYRWKGIFVALMFAVPILALGGRGGQAAAASTIERYEAWHEGFQMLRSHPLFGVGPGMFTEYHHLTAHNSHLLVAAELGVGGLVLWVSVLILTLKVGYAGMRQQDRELNAWGTAVFASAVGTLVSMMFLSLSYHLVVWVHLGLAGAYLGIARKRDPSFEVSYGARGVLVAFVVSIFYLIGLYTFIRLKGY